MTPRFSRQSGIRDTFVPAMPPAQPLDARLRVSKDRGRAGSVVACSRWLTAGGAILAALPGATRA
jgi:hypothetical protein